ncbi:hypothetical protein [Cellulomonas sp. NTE-D12]|uniref:hypothetical protein n=1 Tax=Cellulomonas sp. NTE-D12 TaxID=2962632 RepID=UPI00308197BC|nr:hypothetical protein CELD12_26250 [Cellulomonas sp. NTE-D12]
MSTDDTRPLPAADDETPTRAIEPVAADEAGPAVDTAALDQDSAGTTRPLPVAEESVATSRESADAPRPAAATETAPPPRPTGAAAPAPVSAPALAPAPAPTPATPAGPELRVGTVVWGLVVAVVGIGIVSFAWGARIDGGLALIVLLAGAGVALLVGSLVVALRRPHRRDGRA